MSHTLTQPANNPTSTTDVDAAVIEELRAKQQSVWASGDYNKIAALTVPVNETLVAAAGIAPGEKVLDVATGTGHSALAAARRGARVTGIDYVPALLDIARRRATAEQIEAEFTECPAEKLPFPDAAFDVVVSAIGVMFAADHQAAADQIARVCRPGGRIALANWTAQGFVGGMLATASRHVSPPAGAQSPLRWGDEAVVAELFGERITGLAVSTHELDIRFASAAAYADYFLTHYGPTFSAAQRLDEAGRAALRSDLVELAGSFGRADETGALRLGWEYRVFTATRT